ncbi:hypothetical protein [Novipirellula sp.]
MRSHRLIDSLGNFRYAWERSDDEDEPYHPSLTVTVRIDAAVL